MRFGFPRGYAVRVPVGFLRQKSAASVAPTRYARGARPRPPGVPPPSAFGLVRPLPLSFAFGLCPRLSAPAPLGAPLRRALVGLVALLSSVPSPAGACRLGAVPPVSLSPYGRFAPSSPLSVRCPFRVYTGACKIHSLRSLKDWAFAALTIS